MSKKLNRSQTAGRPFSMILLTATTRSAAMICVGTAIGILFESGGDRLGLAVLSPVMGAIAVLSYAAERQLAKKYRQA